VWRDTSDHVMRQGPEELEQPQFSIARRQPLAQSPLHVTGEFRHRRRVRSVSSGLAPASSQRCSAGSADFYNPTDDKGCH
jgi:hypothetical protein